ncbi:hypothetical protein BDZ91DRAFT_715044 [Kalaharituber pfeilii]|nr:hypothetical protein BDZ91DRAFT_715044 [Kalaharituber pfeilii]
MAIPTPGGIPLGIPTGMADMNLHLPPIPGLDVVQKLFLKFGLDPSHLMSFGMAITVFASLAGFFSYAMNGLYSLWSFISNNCISSATIHSSDQAYLYIMKWLATNKVSTDCRKFCVTSKKNPNSARVKRYSMYNYHHGRAGQEDEDDDEEEDDLGPKLKYNPAPGLSYFWYRKHLIIMQRSPDNGFLNNYNEAPDETMVLMTIGRSPNLLRSLLAEARAHYIACERRKTTVYTVNTSNFQKSWDNGRSRTSRDISTVIMEDKDKELILRDTKDYLNPVTARWYAERGLPYRRGYLFYGPPGTGKTSLTLALAGELKLNLYIFNLGAGGGVTDETLGQLFQALPRKCIVLLEDIDCAGIGRGHSGVNGFADDGFFQAMEYSDSENSDEEEKELEQGRQGSCRKQDGDGQRSESTHGLSAFTSSDKSNSPDAGKSSKPSNSNLKAPVPPRNMMRAHQNKSQISFSGLLNAIDGVASHEGRILIMTTNHRERLDPALIRPGRVDVQIEFGYANKETIRRVFTELYKGLTDLPHDGPPLPLPPSLIRKDSFDAADPLYQPSPVDSVNRYSFSCSIETLAERFASTVPAGIFTPAELQGFLMMYKHQPQAAVAEVAAWVERKLIEKGKLTRRTRATKPSTKRKHSNSSWVLCERVDPLKDHRAPIFQDCSMAAADLTVSPGATATTPALEAEKPVLNGINSKALIPKLTTEISNGSSSPPQCTSVSPTTATVAGPGLSAIKGKAKSKCKPKRDNSKTSTSGTNTKLVSGMA